MQEKRTTFVCNGKWGTLHQKKWEAWGISNESQKPPKNRITFTIERGDISIKITLNIKLKIKLLKVQSEEETKNNSF